MEPFISLTIYIQREVVGLLIDLILRPSEVVFAPQELLHIAVRLFFDLFSFHTASL